MRFAYADPPYPGMAHLYKNHPDYAGEVDHKALIERLVDEFPDGWALSTNMRDLATILPMCPSRTRTMAWIKPNAAPQSHQPELMYAWEPVLILPVRKPREYIRDYFQATIAGRHNWFVGEKPPNFSSWLFRCLGALPGDELVDLFPGSGAVSRAWDKFQRQMPLPLEKEKGRQLTLTASGDG